MVSTGTAARETAIRRARAISAQTQVFGRFGMRIFRPQLMESAHWHGHAEVNFLKSATMTYDIDGVDITIPPSTPVIFWAGVPHRLKEVRAEDGGEPLLCNIYLPLDEFLSMPHIASVQADILAGAMVMIDPALIDLPRLELWYRDYRSRNPSQADLVKMELNAVLRRTCLAPLKYLHRAGSRREGNEPVASIHVRHVVAMVRHVLENLDRPLSNREVASVTGLNETYAMSLFTATLHLSLKRFVIRMRLLRARAMLWESDLAIALIAQECGFGSMSQFYHHYRAAYGATPNHTRLNGPAFRGAS
jgi:AraC-like DNA-binding protein